MEKILIDTDVVLNVLLREEPFFESSSQVFARLECGDVRGFLTATTMTNIYYIAQNVVAIKSPECVSGNYLKRPA